MSFELQWEARGVLRRLFGSVSMRDRHDSFEAICADARFDKVRYCVSDYSDVGDYQWDLEGTREIAAAHVGPLITNPRLVFAAVTSRADVLASIRAFIGTGLSSAPYRVFPTLAAARLWLGEGC